LTAIQIHYTEAGGITGHIMLLCMMLMYTTAHAKIRQQSFETFWYTHHLFIPFLLGMYTHATGCFVRDTADPFSPFDGENFWGHCLGYEGWRWELWGGGLYFLERVYREIRSRRETQIVRVVRHPYGMSHPNHHHSKLTDYRCHGNSIPKAIDEVQGRPMAFSQRPICFP
jgi:NADPH oxidase 1